MSNQKKAEFKELFENVCVDTIDNSRLPDSEEIPQHGSTTCLLHSIAVAYYSFRLAKFLRPFSFHDTDLIRGALLHDYFLYDWHDHEPGTQLHGFYHPSRALKNAEDDFTLSKIEKDIIRKHMFPLTLYPPKYRETVLVCIIDKACCVFEVMRRRGYKNNSIQYAHSFATEKLKTVACSK